LLLLRSLKVLALASDAVRLAFEWRNSVFGGRYREASATRMNDEIERIFGTLGGELSELRGVVTEGGDEREY
jgi:hypothetical protein